MARKPQPKLDPATMELLGNPPPNRVMERVIEYNNAHSGGTRVLRRGDHELVAPLHDIVEVIADLQGEKHLPRLRRRVERAITRMEPKVKAGSASQDEFINLAHDLVILFAIDVLEGRETLSIN